MARRLRASGYCFESYIPYGARSARSVHSLSLVSAKRKSEKKKKNERERHKNLRFKTLVTQLRDTGFTRRDSEERLKPLFFATSCPRSGPPIMKFRNATWIHLSPSDHLPSPFRKFMFDCG